jgi:hypothetical protein
MSSFIFLGKKYEADEFLHKVVILAHDLAKNVRLEVPLPRDTDLGDVENEETQQQVSTFK